MNQIPLPLTSQPAPTHSPHHELGAALAAFDALRPGQSALLVLTGAPREILARFQQERKGEFDWTPVHEGPDSCQVEVSRRAEQRGSLRSVNEALSWDHDRLDDLEARAFKARDLGDLTEAGVLYAIFARGLRRHIRFEEEILFPEFETKAGFSSAMGPTAVMRDEHREILLCLDRIQDAIGQRTSPVDSIRHTFHSILGNHNLKEENIVYPGTDRVLTPLERDALVARIQAM